MYAFTTSLLIFATTFPNSSEIDLFGIGISCNPVVSNVVGIGNAFEFLGKETLPTCSCGIVAVLLNWFSYFLGRTLNEALFGFVIWSCTKSFTSPIPF